MNRIKSYLLIIILIAPLTILGVCTAIGQTTSKQDSVSEIIEPSATDAFVEDDFYEDQQNGEHHPHEEARIKANAFDTINTSTAAVTNWRKLDSGFVKKLKNAPEFDYVKTGLVEPESKPSTSGSFNFDKIILYVAIIVFILILIWYLKENDLFLFRKKAAARKAVANNEDDERNIFSIRFSEAIKDALNAENYRLAVRLQYLQLLKVLSEKKIIKYEPDKTNFEYLLQVRSTPYYTDFLNATHNFERSWYGLFRIDAELYNRIENSFTHLYKKINA